MSGEMVRALGGWSGGGSTSDDYGSGFTPERLYGAIQVVRYDGLDLSPLSAVGLTPAASERRSTVNRCTDFQ